MSFLKSLPTDAKIFDVFASRPEVYEPFVEMVERVTRGDSPLSAGERELIGAFVASLNTCTLCVDIHSEAAKAHGVDLDELDPKLVPVLDLVRKLTESPHKVVAKDLEAVYEAGWNEAALHDVVLVTCIASFMNRFVFGLGIAATDHAHAHAQARARARADYTGAAGNAIATDGYASRFRKLLEEKDAEE